MELVMLAESQIAELARQSWAVDLNSQAAVAEALRAELWARQVSTRRTLCQRVIDLVQPVRQINLDDVRGILAELECSGDVTVGDRGRLAAAPLRVVDLGEGRYLVCGGPTTARLRQLLGQKDIKGAVSRHLTVSVDSQAALHRRLVASGGILLTPARWSGLDCTPPADDAWLAGLDDDLRANSEAPAAVQEGYGDWRYYAPDSGEAEQRLRWKRPGSGDSGRLWRARHERGFRLYVWSSGESPLQGDHLRLTQDQASRTAFALDKAANCPVVVQGIDHGAFKELNVNAFLPTAEYRFLLTLGERLEEPGVPTYRFPESAWSQVVSMLETRLGVAVNVEVVS